MYSRSGRLPSSRNFLLANQPCPSGSPSREAVTRSCRGLRSGEGIVTSPASRRPCRGGPGAEHPQAKMPVFLRTQSFLGSWAVTLGSLLTLFASPKGSRFTCRACGLKPNFVPEGARSSPLQRGRQNRDMEKEAQRPRRLGTKPGPAPPAGTGHGLIWAAGRKLLPSKWDQNLNNISHRERGCPCASVNVPINVWILWRRNQAWREQKSQGPSTEAVCQKKLNLNWIKSLDLTQTSLQKNRGMKESVKHTTRMLSAKPQR